VKEGRGGGPQLLHGAGRRPSAAARRGATRRNEDRRRRGRTGGGEEGRPARHAGGGCGRAWEGCRRLETADRRRGRRQAGAARWGRVRVHLAARLGREGGRAGDGRPAAGEGASVLQAARRAGRVGGRRLGTDGGRESGGWGPAAAAGGVGNPPRRLWLLLEKKTLT
jgi:hypothetical protein